VTNAADRDVSTFSVTDQSDGKVWLKLEFGKTFIQKVVIHYIFFNYWYDATYWCVRSEANFRVCVDLHNNVDVSVHKGEVKQKSCGTLKLTYGLEQSDQIKTLTCNIEGDTVKLSKNTGHIAVCEVAVTSTGTLLLDIT
jgi:hypothetical protein